jgi:hypothetical protein
VHGGSTTVDFLILAAEPTVNATTTAVETQQVPAAVRDLAAVLI